MNIPQSAIEPFGITGIPSLTTSADAVNDMLQEMFDVVMGYTVTYTIGRNNRDLIVDDLAIIFIRRVLKRNMGTKTKEVWTTEKITNKDGELLAITLIVHYSVPNDPMLYTSRFHMNPHCLVF